MHVRDREEVRQVRAHLHPLVKIGQRTDVVVGLVRIRPVVHLIGDHLAQTRAYCNQE